VTTKRTQVGLHLDAATLERLREMSERTGVPMAEFMRRAITAALDAESKARRKRIAGKRT
jgi:predicted DNA-binding protein